MAKEKVADAMAYIPGTAGQKNRYIKIGTAMAEAGRPHDISIKIDSLPIDKGWTGWINLWRDETRPSEGGSKSPSYNDKEPF